MFLFLLTNQRQDDVFQAYDLFFGKHINQLFKVGLINACHSNKET